MLCIFMKTWQVHGPHQGGVRIRAPAAWHERARRRRAGARAARGRQAGVERARASRALTAGSRRGPLCCGSCCACPEPSWARVACSRGLRRSGRRQPAISAGPGLSRPGHGWRIAALLRCPGRCSARSRSAHCSPIHCRPGRGARVDRQACGARDARGGARGGAAQRARGARLRPASPGPCAAAHPRRGSCRQTAAQLTPLPARSAGSPPAAARLPLDNTAAPSRSHAQLLPLSSASSDRPVRPPCLLPASQRRTACSRAGRAPCGAPSCGSWRPAAAPWAALWRRAAPTATAWPRSCPPARSARSERPCPRLRSHP